MKRWMKLEDQFFILLYRIIFVLYAEDRSIFQSKIGFTMIIQFKMDKNIVGSSDLQINRN